jgi:hypothetical protein
LKRKIPVAVLLVVLGLWLGLRRGRRVESAPLDKHPAQAAFLVTFGLDDQTFGAGNEQNDWNGSVTCPSCQIAGWQFDSHDELTGTSWKCSTRRELYWDTPYERKLERTTQTSRVTRKGILIELAKPTSEAIRVETRQGSFSFPGNLVIGDAPKYFLSSRVSVAAVPASEALATNPAEVEDYPSLTETRDGTLWMAYQSWADGADRIFVRRRSNGVWANPEEVTESTGDYFRTAIAQDGAGRVWVVWAAQVDSNFDLYAGSFDGTRWSGIERLTSAPNSNIFHTLIADAKGNLYLAYQSARSGNFDIYMRIFDGRTWSPEIQVSSDPANDWEPALAVAPDGSVTVLWDTYANGSYNVVGRTWHAGTLGPLLPITHSSAFAARVSAQYDQQGRLWLAWDQGDFNWGKDFGFAIPASGRGLLTRRQTRVAVIEDGRLVQTLSPISECVPVDLSLVYHHPTIRLDAAGNPWVFFRTRINLPVTQAQAQFRALWRLEATTYRSGRWTPMIEFTQGYGRIDMPVAVTLQNDGKLAVAWVTDGRQWPLGRPQEPDVRFATIPSSPAQAAPEFVAYQPPADYLPPSHPQEAEDIQRVREYRVNIGGQTLRIARGDMHRHTDESWDGNRDGSLDDAYRYALDAAGFDYLGVTDHKGDPEDTAGYSWWRIQKAVDLYTIPGRFTPLYSYERSVRWPNGHRNVFFALRGRPIFDIPEEEQKGAIGASGLFAHLRRLGGVAVPHTSATGAGTDWRDYDPVLQPLVEIYQGYGQDYGGSQEMPGGPRAPTLEQAGRFAGGFVSDAWAKGIKMGVEASSDHVSTHISYACFYVTQLSREGILAAMKSRHSYAATDNIIVDLRMGDYFMGDAFQAANVPPLKVDISGTGPLGRVDVIRNNLIVYSTESTNSQMRLTWVDAHPLEGQAWYYVRVEQSDGQLCWSSPIWVERK